MDWTIVSPTRDRLAESPMWHAAEEALYWTDWYGPTLHRKRWGQDKVESWTIANETVLGSFVFASRGRLLLAVDSGLVLFDPATADPEFPDVTPRDARALRELAANSA